jgi:hypothetical protein
VTSSVRIATCLPRLKRGKNHPPCSPKLLSLIHPPLEGRGFSEAFYKATLTPALESVTVDATALIEELYPKGTGDYRQDILAQTYALERAYHEQSCDEALADPRVADYHLNQAIITDVYLSILNVPDTTTKPDAAARAMCADILRCGRW